VKPTCLGCRLFSAAGGWADKKDEQFSVRLFIFLYKKKHCDDLKKKISAMHFLCCQTYCSDFETAILVYTIKVKIAIYIAKKVL